MSYRNELAFGLDIGDRSIKALQFRERKHKTYLVGFGEITLPEGIIEKGEILKMDELVKQLQTLLKKAHIAAKRVVLAIPESKSFIATLNLTITDPETVEEQIKLELSKHLPYELSDVWWDFKVISNSPSGSQILVGATPKALISSYQEAIQRAGLIPLIFDLEPLSIARSVLHEQKTQGCVAIIDLGATKSTIIIANPQTVLATSDGRSPASELDKNVSTALRIDLKAAEEMKYKYGVKDGPEQYLAVVKTYLTTLSERINSTISFTLNRIHSCPAISEVILSGGGSLLTGLPETLSDLLHLPVRSGDPWVNVQETIGTKVGIKTGIRFTTSCGLAMAGLNQEHII